MHLYRLLTAFILLPVLLFLLVKGPPGALFLIVLLSGILGWHEFRCMTNLPLAVFVSGALILILAFIFLENGTGSLLLGVWGAFLTFFICFLRGFEGLSTLNLFVLSLTGLTYILLGFGHLLLLLNLPQGRFWILFLLATIFGTDTGAFYAGKALGRHKLIPRISPGKTWEGAVGGLFLGTILGVWVGGHFSLAGGSLLGPLAAILSLVGQFGDLLESFFKRGFGVKDSGSILPGHGGILDRVDALIFAAPWLYWFLYFKGHGY